MALEASESRIWAGIHFRTDVNVGRDMGHKIGGAVIDYAKADGSD